MQFGNVATEEGPEGKVRKEKGSLSVLAGVGKETVLSTTLKTSVEETTVSAKNSVQNGATRCTGKLVAPSSGSSGDGASWGTSGLADEASHVEQIGQDITQVIGLGAVGQTKPGGAFEASPLLVGVATFGVTEATLAQAPRGGVDLEVASQAQ